MSFASSGTHQNELLAPTEKLVVFKEEPLIEHHRRLLASRFVTACMRAVRAPITSEEFAKAVDGAVAALPAPPPAYIVAAAVRTTGGAIYTLPPGMRVSPAGSHADIAAALPAIEPGATIEADGFMTSHGSFVDRAEAFRIAFRANQRMKLPPGGVQTLLLHDLA